MTVAPPRNPRDARQNARDLAALWFGVLGGPAAVLTNEAIVYLMTVWSCGRLDPVTSIMLHVVPLLLFVVACAAGVVAWAHRTTPLRSEQQADEEDRSQRGFMALVGIGMSIMSAGAIVAMWLPTLYMNPCVHT